MATKYLNDTVIDKIKGLIFGQAIGDALGLATEFLSKIEVCSYYPEAISGYNEIIQTAIGLDGNRETGLMTLTSFFVF